MRSSIISFILLLGFSLPASAALLVDDCEGNGLKGNWSSYCDKYSSILPTPFAFTQGGYATPHCARLDVEIKAGEQYPYAGMNTMFSPQNLSSYEGVRFWAKGSGNWSCQLPIPATATAYNHYLSPIQVTDQWTLFELPFSSFVQTWGTHVPWDPTAVNGVQWSLAGYPGTKAWICVNGIEFYKKGEVKLSAASANPIVKEPKVNQQGYLPGAHKTFSLTLLPNGPKQGDKYQVLDEKGSTALGGTLSGDVVDDTPSTGEKVMRVDFTDLRTPGRYTLSVGTLKSQPFEIGEDVYFPLFKDALRCFYLIRCGTAIDDPITGIKHEACHMKDAEPKDGSAAPDVTGGWHNAGDFGKWTLEDSISCAYMLWTYELRHKKMAVLNNQIPESGKGSSDLLNEAKWGLTWLLKMQRADGSVWHKVDTEDKFCFGTVPEKDPYPRFVQGAGTIDAADFTGVMAQAYRVYWNTDQAFAKKCYQAAQKSWAWLEKNPNVVQHDPDYVDTDPSQEKMWALGEMARLTQDPALLERFKTESSLTPLKACGWMTPQMFGYMALATNPKTPADYKAALSKNFGDEADSISALAQKSGYQVALTKDEYWWESNENLLGKTALLLFAHYLTSENSYKETALDQMGYVLGENSLGLSFVTGHGGHAIQHPYHWDQAALGKTMPGWVAGGANNGTTGADPLLVSVIQRGIPPAKCFVDACGGTGSWASGEGETSENAALVFCSGYLSGN
jgi:endoglucanase